MKYIKKFFRYIKEAAVATEVGPLTQPTEPKPPTMPKKLQDELAGSQKNVTALDVVNRFIQEMKNKGQSVKKYM